MKAGTEANQGLGVESTQVFEEENVLNVKSKTTFRGLTSRSNFSASDYINGETNRNKTFRNQTMRSILTDRFMSSIKESQRSSLSERYYGIKTEKSIKI